MNRPLLSRENGECGPIYSFFFIFQTIENVFEFVFSIFSFSFLPPFPTLFAVPSHPHFVKVSLPSSNSILSVPIINSVNFVHVMMEEIKMSLPFSTLLYASWSEACLKLINLSFKNKNKKTRENASVEILAHCKNSTNNINCNIFVFFRS